MELTAIDVSTINVLDFFDDRLSRSPNRKPIGSGFKSLTAHHIHSNENNGLWETMGRFLLEAPRDYGFWGVLWCVFMGRW